MAKFQSKAEAIVTLNKKAVDATLSALKKDIKRLTSFIVFFIVCPPIFIFFPAAKPRGY